MLNLTDEELIAEVLKMRREIRGLKRVIQEKKLKASQRDLIRKTLTRLLENARQDKWVAREICSLAGQLIREDPTLKKHLRKGSRWTEGYRRECLIGYARLLPIVGGDEALARKWLRMALGRHEKPVSDKTIQNILSEAAKTTPIMSLPDEIRPAIERRLKRGIRTRHRGGQ